MNRTKSPGRVLHSNLRILFPLSWGKLLKPDAETLQKAGEAVLTEFFSLKNSLRQGPLDLSKGTKGSSGFQKQTKIKNKT